MAITAGVISQVSVTDTTANLSATAATGGTGPYTYQWYRSTTSGFTPGGGNIISGATSLTLADSGLLPNTTYYYKVVATDTGHSNDTAEYTQLAVVTAMQTLSQNQFQQTEYIGTMDQHFNYNTHPCEVDVSQTTSLFAGQAVKMVDSAGGVPKVVACTSAADAVFGFVNYNFKNVSWAAGQAVEVSLAGNVMYLRATSTISRMAKVRLDIATVGGVKSVTGSSSDTLVGWAYDKASTAGDLIRVYIQTPYFGVDA